MTSHISHVIDIMPTLIEAARAEYPARYKRRPITPAAGRSLVSVFRGTAGPSNRPLFWEHMGNAAIRQGPWKLVRSKTGPWELYNLDEDRNELQNRAGERKEIVARMTRDWEEWAHAVGAAE